MKRVLEESLPHNAAEVVIFDDDNSASSGDIGNNLVGNINNFIEDNVNGEDDPVQLAFMRELNISSAMYHSNYAELFTFPLTRHIKYIGLLESLGYRNLLERDDANRLLSMKLNSIIFGIEEPDFYCNLNGMRLFFPNSGPGDLAMMCVLSRCEKHTFQCPENCQDVTYTKIPSSRVNIVVLGHLNKTTRQTAASKGFDVYSLEMDRCNNTVFANNIRVSRYLKLHHDKKVNVYKYKRPCNHIECFKEKAEAKKNETNGTLLDLLRSETRDNLVCPQLTFENDFIKNYVDYNCLLMFQGLRGRFVDKHKCVFLEPMNIKYLFPIEKMS